MDARRDIQVWGTRKQENELDVPIWTDSTGEMSFAIQMKDFAETFKVIYCFQSWCSGCTVSACRLKKMVETLNDKDYFTFLAIQTVFEGSEANTFERLVDIQKEYELRIPFGHDVGTEATNYIATTMVNYRTGGTPWFIF